MGKPLEVVTPISGFTTEEALRSKGTQPRAFSAQVQGQELCLLSYSSFPSWIAFGSRIMLSATLEITREQILFRGDGLYYPSLHWKVTESHAGTLHTSLCLPMFSLFSEVFCCTIRES